MNSVVKLISVVICAVLATGVKLPPFIKPCSENSSVDEFSTCILEQAKIVQPELAKGIPELSIDPLDPLSLTDIRAKAGTFNIKSTNVLVKGLRKIRIQELRWDLKKGAGHMKIFGNLTFTSDYETDGRILLIPITGNGKLTVKMYDTEMVFKYKIKKTKDANGIEHLHTYETRPSQKYGNVKLHMSNILGGAAIGDTVNTVLNENWRELMAEVGPPYVKAVAAKVNELINKIYTQVPYDDIIHA